jgi:hypothetical protein
MKDKIRTKGKISEGTNINTNVQGTTIKPKAIKISEVDELNFLEDEKEQEKIAEGLSIGVPTQPLLRPTGLGRYFGKNVRVLLRDANVMEGFLKGRSWDYLHMLNFVETGKDQRIAGSWCGIALDSVSRVYPSDVQVEKISKPSDQEE